MHLDLLINTGYNGFALTSPLDIPHRSAQGAVEPVVIPLDDPFGLAICQFRLATAGIESLSSTNANRRYPMDPLTGGRSVT